MEKDAWAFEAWLQNEAACFRKTFNDLTTTSSLSRICLSRIPRPITSQLVSIVVDQSIGRAFSRFDVL